MNSYFLMRFKVWEVLEDKRPVVNALYSPWHLVWCKAHVMLMGFQTLRNSGSSHYCKYE